MNNTENKDNAQNTQDRPLYAYELIDNSGFVHVVNAHSLREAYSIAYSNAKSNYFDDAD